MSRVLVLSPHPDDEAIGCGGTLRRHVVNGDSVHVIFLTSGEHGCKGQLPELTQQVREAEARAAADILGVSSIEFWRQPDGALNVSPELAERLCRMMTDQDVDIVYVPHDREMHVDHQAAVALVRAALAQFSPSAERPAVLMFEVWTPLQQLDHIEDISEFVEVKRAAIRAHASQCAIMRFDEAALALNRYRGEMHSWPGGDYAEVFQKLS